MKTKLSTLIYSLVALFAASSCTDDRIWDDNDIIGDGEATISATIAFKSFDSALDSRTPGDELDGIDNLAVFVFDKTGESVVLKQPIENYTIDKDGNNSTPDKGEYDPEAVLPTVKAKFDLKLQYGSYKIYAVANADWDKIKDVESEEELQNISFDWNSEKISGNKQMFGWFTKKEASSVSAEKLNAEVVSVNTSDITLSAWLVRLASKVTVSFDASQLYNNVFVYLKSVEVKDIPSSCYLGKRNEPNADDAIIKDGEKYIYYDQTKFPEGPTVNDFNINDYEAVLTNGKPTYGSDHSHKAEDALFFYENMQGSGKDKAQDADGDKKIDFPNGNDPNEAGFKDDKKYGTYIEVKAYYISRNTDNGAEANQGEIIYRFMLGKDIKTDYNAQRNYHYKLKLILKGWANEADWHIVYDTEERSIIAPNPYYISYLYNHSMMLPLTIKTGETEIESIEAKIASNNWAPLNGTNGATVLPGSGEYKLYWAGADNPTAYPWNGFLSLRKTEQTDVVAPSNMKDWTVNSNESYYTSTQRGKITYSGDQIAPSKISVSEALENGVPHVSHSIENGQNTYIVNVPLWTRAKTLISQTGYTGNNPYVAYRRQAKIHFLVKLKDGTTLDTESKDDYATGDNIEIQQVRRIVNPKGIWRAGNDNSSFDVDLKVLPDEESKKFQSLRSDGPWRAYVFRDTKRGTGNETGWSDASGTIKLEGGKETTTGTITVKDRDGIEREYETIEGKTGSEMKFTVNFNGTTSEDNPNYAIIRVEYQNYTCYHLIFVRQGYGADAILDNGAKWMTSNNVAKDEVAASPLDEGSLFKFGNWDQPIDALDNKNGKNPWIEVTPNDFINNAAGTLNLYPSGTSTWDNITSQSTKSTANGFADQSSMRVATEDDFNQLKNSDDIEMGFGVLYGGDSEKCLEPIEDVYGYDRNNTNRGMRGCFVYNYRTGKNIFFPIGASGYGHRKDALKATNGTTYKGVLRYSAASRWGYFDAKMNDQGHGYINGVNGAPIFFDIFRRPGACYWFKNPKIPDAGKPDNNYPTWDINYFSFDFGSIPGTNVAHGKDALFVRSIAN